MDISVWKCEEEMHLSPVRTPVDFPKFKGSTRNLNLNYQGSQFTGEAKHYQWENARDSRRISITSFEGNWRRFDSTDSDGRCSVETLASARISMRDLSSVSLLPNNSLSSLSELSVPEGAVPDDIKFIQEVPLTDQNDSPKPELTLLEDESVLPKEQPKLKLLKQLTLLQNEYDLLKEQPKAETDSPEAPKAKLTPLEDFAVEHQIPSEDWTSIMIRNIPCRYTQSELIDEITMLGFIVDFLYLPPARRSSGNLGYAFVNFVDPKQTAEFLLVCQGYSFSLQPKSKKKAHIIYARLQGFEKNVEFYKVVKVSKTKNHPFVDYEANKLSKLNN
jgi:hypothetical protein